MGHQALLCVGRLASPASLSLVGGPRWALLTHRGCSLLLGNCPPVRLFPPPTPLWHVSPETHDAPPISDAPPNAIPSQTGYSSLAPPHGWEWLGGSPHLLVPPSTHRWCPLVAGHGVVALLLLWCPLLTAASALKWSASSCDLDFQPGHF